MSFFNITIKLLTSYITQTIHVQISFVQVNDVTMIKRMEDMESLMP